MCWSFQLEAWRCPIFAGLPTQPLPPSTHPLTQPSPPPSCPPPCPPLPFPPPAARSFNNIEDGFYISPAFLDKLSIHVAKNFLDLPKIKVPLILGIWGGKGQGEWRNGLWAGSAVRGSMQLEGRGRQQVVEGREAQQRGCIGGEFQPACGS